MMSERKRKQKWSLNPRGKAWSENTNKFGQKLMEKMGWSSGKGLGANEDGMTEHIRVAYKNDTQGMGFKGTDDKWTEHESKFTELLNTLAGPKSENKSEAKIESLEKKSETSKARVHYRKFTRGKDLSRYSEKDLANIFGKKSLKEVLKPENVKEEIEDEKENVDDKSFGVVTHNGGSMLDYFKNKLPNFKNSSSKIAPEVANDDNESDIERPSFGFGFSGNGNQNDNSLDETEKPSFGLGFNGSGNQNNSFDESKPASKKFEKKKKNDPTDNFRKQCFGLGYDRYNGDESKPKSNYMSFVKATDTTEKKKPLKYGITKFVVSEDKTGAVSSENSDKTKLQTVFMSFVKGSDANESKDDDSSGKKMKNKKRKNKNEDCDDDDTDKSTTKKIKIDESESTELKNKKKDKGIKPTFVSFIKENAEVDNGGDDSIKKNKKSKKDKSKTEQSSDKSTETSVVEENQVSNGDVQEDSSISKKKKKDKKSKKVKVDDDLDRIEIEEVVSPKKGKKRKSNGELDVAFTPMKKKFKNFEDLHTLQGEEKIVETPDKKTKKSKKVKNSSELQNGVPNPAFDPLHNTITVQKHHLDAIVEESEISVQISEIQGDTEEKKKSLESECFSVSPNKTEKKKKKKKTKSIEGIDNPCIEEISTLEQTTQSIDDTVVSETPKKKKSKKSKKEKEISTNGIENTAFDENGLENSAFDDSYVESIEATSSKYEIKEKKRKKKEVQATVDECAEDSVNVEKKKKKKKNKVNETEGDSEMNQSELKNGESPKKIKKKKNGMLSIENPCFNSDDSLVSSEVVTPNKYEVKRNKKIKNAGIVNPGLDLTSPPPTENGTTVEDLPVMDDSLMLNVVCTPIIKKDKNDKKLQRRKSVRFSDVNQSIFINNTDSPSDLRKNGGVDNAAYDQFGNRIEENIDALNKQLDDFQAEVENDLNEAKVQVMVGEVGDPDGENEIMSNGEVKLKFKYANFGKMPPWMRKNNGMNPKSSYRHLIKGDIILGFKHTNMHDIKGYNEHLKSGSP